MKKVAFVSLVLIASLLMLQVFLFRGNTQEAQISVPENNAEAKIEPVKNQIFISGDYVIQVRDGKYYVYERNTPST